MKNQLKKFREKLILLKMCITRSSSYITLINSGMILFLFLSKLKEANIIKIHIRDYFIPLFIIGIFSLMVIGWIEIKYLKGMSTELKMVWEFNPEFRKLKKQVDSIYYKINKYNLK